MNLKAWWSRQFVTGHGVTGQRCCCDPAFDFVCTSTWLAAHYWSSLRQCMAAAWVWSWSLTSWGGRHGITATEVLAFMVWGDMAAPEWAFMMEVSGNWRWDPGNWREEEGAWEKGRRVLGGRKFFAEELRVWWLVWLIFFRCVRN